MIEPWPSTTLVSDRDVEFLLYEVHDAEGLTSLSHFEEHARETFDLMGTLAIGGEWIDQAGLAQRGPTQPVFIPPRAAARRSR